MRRPVRRVRMRLKAQASKAQFRELKPSLRSPREAGEGVSSIESSRV